MKHQGSNRPPQRPAAAGVVLLTVMLAACQNQEEAPAHQATLGVAQAAQSEASAPSLPDGHSGQPIKANASLDDAGALEVAGGGYQLKLVASHCVEESQLLTVCDGNVDLTVIGPSLASGQTLKPNALYLKTNATFYAGPLDSSSASAGYSMVISDVNADGHGDLLLWTGREGAYGAASYSVYLSDADRNTLVRSREFSDLTVGYNGLFQVGDTGITATSRSGCCTHVQERYALESGKPLLVERVTTDATGGKESPAVTVEKRVDGKMQQVRK